MKKTYIAPSTMAIDIKADGMLQCSLMLSSEAATQGGGCNARSRVGDFFDDEDFE